MARKKDGAKESANRRRVAEDVARIRSAGIPVLAKDIAESLSMSTVTVGKHLRALGLSFHGPMGWYGPDEGEYSAWDADCKTWCAPSATVEGAMALKGKTVQLCRADVKLPDGAFFLADIIGLDVVDENENKLGTLKEVLSPSVQQIYVVEGQREIMIPAVPEFILETNIEAGYIRVRLIEGM